MSDTGPLMVNDIAVIDRVLTTTRAVRKRLDVGRPVPRHLIYECIRVASQAPNGANLERWRWLVISDRSLREAIGDVYRRAVMPYLDLLEDEFGDDPDQSAMLSSARALADMVHTVPAMVVPCQLGRHDDTRRFLRDRGYPWEVSHNMASSGFYGSIWPALWSFMLAARVRGLGTTPTTMHLALENEVASLVSIPKGVSQIALLPIAFFSGEDFRPAKRRAAEEITYWDRWEE